MDFYQGTPNLPMTGGDVFTDIAEDIVDLNNTVVFKAGTQTITGDKTFSGVFNATNQNILASAVASPGYANIIGASAVAGQNLIVANATNGSNQLEATGAGGINSISGERNTIVSNLAVGSNLIANEIEANGGYNHIISATTSLTANLIEATGGGSNAMSAAGVGGNAMKALGTGVNTISTVSGKNSLTSTSGQIELKTSSAGTTGINIENGGGGITINTPTGGKVSMLSGTGVIELKTAALTGVGINIENTSATTGGITMKTAGTTGAIQLQSTNSKVDITCNAISTIKLIVGTNEVMVVSGSGVVVDLPITATRYNLDTTLSTPLVSWAVTLYSQDINTTSSQMVVGFPQADISHINRPFKMPFRARCVGYSITGDADTHSEVILTVKLNSGVGATGGSNYLSQTNTLAANAIQNNSSAAREDGNIYNFKTPPGAGTFTTADIPAGTNIYGWWETDVSMGCDMMFIFYFQQLGE